MLRRASRVLLLATPLLSLIGAGLVKADANVVGLTVTVYNNYGFNASPPVPPQRPIVGTTTSSFINHNFDAQPLFDMYEDFVVKYEGFITAPCTCEVHFLAEADDGTLLYLDDELVTNDWRDKGAGGTVSQPISFNANESKSLVLWYYENGGGAWVRLSWFIDNQWQVVPASAFVMAQATTTVATTTTLEATTTTTLEPTTTTVQTTTTTTEPVTTTSSTTTTLPETTTSSTSTTTTTTTTSVAPTTTYATTTVPVTTTQPPPPTTTIPPVENESVSALLAKSVTEVSVDDISEALTESVSSDLTDEQISEVVDVIAEKVDDLSETELLILAESLTNASDEVKTAFQEKVNVFDGKFDTYVPTGSNISVGERRVLNAVVATIVAAPAIAAGTSTQRRKI